MINGLLQCEWSLSWPPPVYCRFCNYYTCRILNDELVLNETETEWKWNFIYYFVSQHNTMKIILAGSFCLQTNPHEAKMHKVVALFFFFFKSVTAGKAHAHAHAHTCLLITGATLLGFMEMSVLWESHRDTLDAGGARIFFLMNWLWSRPPLCVGGLWEPWVSRFQLTLKMLMSHHWAPRRPFR